MATLINTANSSNGFFGTILTSRGDKAAQAEWDVAVLAVQCAFPACSPVVARNLLDSVYGRHIADSLLSGEPVTTQMTSTEKGRRSFARWVESIQRQTAEGWFED